MLKLDENRNPKLILSHLNEPTPANFDKVLERYKNLDGSLFHHIISSPLCRYERGFGKGRVPDEILNMNAQDRFKNILRTGSITGNPKSYFVNKHRDSLNPAQMDSIKSVSFAFCKNSELDAHFKARGSEYGICFYHDFLEDHGLRPVIYVNDSSEIDLANAVFHSPHLVETYSSKYDMRWENEWRIKGELKFTPEDIAFLIVPDSEYLKMHKWVDGELHDLEQYVMDYLILPSSVFSDPLRYLYMAPHLEHQSWIQITLFGGLLMDFDQFLPPTPDDRKQMYQNDTLQCLSKAAVHEVYERRYIERFFNFFGDLDDKTKKSELFLNLRKAAENAREPRECVRDLVIDGYEKLFRIQQDRITKDWFPPDES